MRATLSATLAAAAVLVATPAAFAGPEPSIRALQLDAELALAKATDLAYDFESGTSRIGALASTQHPESREPCLVTFGVVADGKPTDTRAYWHRVTSVSVRSVLGVHELVLRGDPARAITFANPADAAAAQAAVASLVDRCQRAENARQLLRTGVAGVASFELSAQPGTYAEARKATDVSWVGQCAMAVRSQAGPVLVQRALVKFEAASDVRELSRATDGSSLYIAGPFSMQGTKESFRGAGVKIDVGARPAMQRLAGAARLLRDHCNPGATSSL
jgi:hypothetical protein